MAAASWIGAMSVADAADLRADIEGLNARTVRAYLAIMLRLHRHGPIPFDEHILADVAHCGRKLWTTRIWPALAHLYTVDDDYLCHPGIDGAHAAGPTARQVSASNAARARHEQRRRQLSLIAGDAPHDAQPPAPHAPRTAEPGSAHALRTAEGGSPHRENAANSMRGAESLRAESSAEGGAAHAVRSAEAPAAQAGAALARTHTHTPPLSSSSQISGDSSGGRESGRGSGGGSAASAETPAQAAETAAQPDAETPAQPAQPDAEAAAQPPAQVRTFAAPRTPRPRAQAPAAHVPLPPDWRPSDDDSREARKRGYDPDEAAECFRDVYLGNGALSPDWSAKFRRFAREGIRGLTPQRPEQRGMVMPIAGGLSPGAPGAAASDAGLTEEEKALKRRVLALWVVWRREKAGPEPDEGAVLEHCRAPPDRDLTLRWVEDLERWHAGGRRGDRPPELRDLFRARDSPAGEQRGAVA